MNKGLLILFFILNTLSSQSQRLLHQEDFETGYLVKDFTKMNRFFGIDTYVPNKKFAVDIISNSLQPPYDEFFVSFPCFDDSVQKNLYTSILVYDKDIINWRQFLIIKTDSVLPSKKELRIFLDVKIQPCSEFVIDSLGIKLFESYDDILAFFKNKSNEMEGTISLKEANSANWTKISGNITTQANTSFAMLGNFGFNNQKVLEQNRSCCVIKKNAEAKGKCLILIDNIQIIQ